jgi:predicted transcriptional regulator
MTVDDERQPTTILIEMAAEIVAAYVTKNSVVSADLPRIIEQVHGALATALRSSSEPAKEDLKPAVPIKRSVEDDYIVCLEDGMKFKSLKRHLRTKYNMSPEEYRQRWGLPYDYPMVAPNYAKARSDLAKKMGLGRAMKDSDDKKPARRGKSKAAA